jgi:hypothetical protein
MMYFLQNHLVSKLTWLVLLTTLSLMACSTLKPIRLYPHPAEMRQELLTHIPLGTLQSVALATMQKNGFTCRLMRDASFSAMGTVYEHINFIYGDREKSTGYISRRWQIALVLKAAEVVDILVSYGLIGP